MSDEKFAKMLAAVVGKLKTSLEVCPLNGVDEAAVRECVELIDSGFEALGREGFAHIMAHLLVYAYEAGVAHAEVDMLEERYA